MHRTVSKAVRKYKKTFFGLIAGIVAVVTLSAVLSACTSDSPKAQTNESNLQQTSYDKLAARQPALTMDYSPTRATANFWAKTWNKPGKLSYVYFQNSEGKLTGYYVFKGLPVSYCVSLTPNYTFVGTPDDGSDAKDQRVPAPSIDGVYYSGGQCGTYYGQDATTGAYIEYTAGLGINVLLYDQPLTNHPNVPNLGPTK